MPSGGAAALVPLLVFIVTLAGSTCACAAWMEEDVPGPSDGDIVFYADAVSFYSGAGQNTEEIYCVISNDQVEFVEEEDGLRGKLRYLVEILDTNGDVVGSTEKVLLVSASSTEDAHDRGVVQVLQSEVAVPPGRYRVRVVIEDLNAVKKEILSYILRRHKAGEVEVWIESKVFPPDRVSISDVEFARSLRRTSEGSFQKSGFEVIPNAQRRYGLLLPELVTFFEVYDPARNHVGDTLEVAYSVVNKSGAEIYGSRQPLAMKGERFGSTALFDVASLSTGSYLLKIGLMDRNGDTLATAERRFDVIWSVVSWGRYTDELIGDMTYVFTEDEMQTFKSLSAAEQEEFLKEFWLRLDPTPGTAQNEALMEHYRRVSYADKSFGTATTRGALTDRGRLYIKYGPPDDIQSFYSDYDLVKGTHDMTGGSNPVPTDPFSRARMKAGEDANTWGRTSSEADAHSDQRGGSTVHGKAYEIWTYDGDGQPVRRLSERVATSAAMRFILVDEKGYGDYSLVYSTEKQEY